MTALRGVRVLIVDDNQDTRELYEMVLQAAGAEVRTAHDAGAGFRAMLAWLPSVLVSDLAMPTMDGLALIREVRAVPRLRDVPAIAISGFSRASDREAALAAGFQEHVSKPFGPQDLVAVVKRWAPAAAE